jgi:hypothetical protein
VLKIFGRGATGRRREGVFYEMEFEEEIGGRRQEAGDEETGDEG